MRVMITGGGTGGHTSPATAIVEELRKRDPRLLLQWVGKAGAIEERVARRLEIPFRAIPATGWPRRPGPKQALAAARMAVGMVQAFRYLRAFQPDLVIGVGGYVSIPAVLLAQRMAIATYVHEQNKRLGMANRLLAKRATQVFLSFDESIGAYPKERAMVVGNPVRQDFLRAPSRASARRGMGLHPTRPVVLVVGGSQGAQSINTAVGDALSLPDAHEVQWLWMTGKPSHAEARARAEASRRDVRVFEFIDDMAQACAAADIIISRAGASSTAEIAAMGRASVLVPYPFATDDHQTANAQAFVDAGAGVLLPDAECTGDRLAGLLASLLEDPARRERMEEAALTLARPHAAESIVDTILTHHYGRHPS